MNDVKPCPFCENCGNIRTDNDVNERLCPDCRELKKAFQDVFAEIRKKTGVCIKQ